MDISGINPIVAIVIGLLLIGLVFRVVKGVIRLVLIAGILDLSRLHCAKLRALRGVKGNPS